MLLRTFFAAALLGLASVDASAQGMTPGQTVFVSGGSGAGAEGKVVRVDQYGVLVRFPMFDGTWDEKNGPTRYYKAGELQTTKPGAPAAQPPPPAQPAQPGAGVPAEGAKVFVKADAGGKEGRVVRVDKYGVLVRFPMFDGTWDEKNGPTRYYQPAELQAEPPQPNAPLQPNVQPQPNGPAPANAPMPAQPKPDAGGATDGGPRLGKYKIVIVNLTSGVATGTLVLKAGGIYEIWDNGDAAPRGSGRYRYDAAAKRVVWIDGINFEMGRGGSFSIENGAHKILWNNKAYAISE